ncbi:hypothetical protein [Ornithinimicrobium avium]|uniref:DNA-directed RNA polymerase specialized sigma24 family protein n=1 Tax=Ornithinimicrobium avium TaxID=2283195 RepID=A0A345NLL6_9MICO|nr:hypothetical protein [Ornithinimicrobium avium]AXH95924.1 hypothetical protein DV701_07085 [Ornithinimicrobium avium]
MTGRSATGHASGDAAPALAATHGAHLHRLAAMLSGSTDAATALVARTLLAAGDQAPAAQEPQLGVDLVRLYLRTAPRRRERAEPSRARDAGDLLRTLRPRARAASVLRLVEDWDTASVARAVGVRPHRVDALVPAAPGLGTALAAVADQHALTGADLTRELDDELRVATPPTSGGDRRRWRWLVAAAVPLAVLAGWAAVTGGPDEAEDRPSVTAGPDDGPRPDLTAAGWKLDEDGEPPRAATGLAVARVLALGARDPAQEVSWPAPMNADASFAVLWCDMPPAQDAHLTVPSATLAVGADEVPLPCAGRDGSPPVTGLVPLPPGGSGQVRLEGDLPPGGGATLAIYNEAGSADAPLPRGSLGDAPEAPEGSVVLDPTDTVPTPDYGPGRRALRPVSVEVGHDSAVRVWVGRSGAVAVDVGGAPATDDGDVRAARERLARDGGPEGSQPDRPDWRTQQADLRWGRWLAWVPGEVRTFDLPDAVRPAPGERATVTVEVVVENMEEHLQVAVLDAARVRVDTGPVQAEQAPRAPALVGGHRLVGAWRLPLDGHRRELLGASATTGPLAAVGVLPADRPGIVMWGWTGVVDRGGQAVELWLASDVASGLQSLQQGWGQRLPLDGGGALHASAPAVPDGGEALLLVYEPVPYEDFDFATASVPPGSWTVGAEPPPTASYPGVQPLAVIGPEDLEDGSASLDLPAHGPVAARVTTEGRGRIRFLIGDHDADNLWDSGGWWSSWTDEPVVSEVDLTFSEGEAERELTVVVEDYEEFTVEVLAPG